MRLVWTALMVACSGLGLSGCHQASDQADEAEQAPVALIQSQTVALSPIQERVEAPGTVQALAERQASIMPTVSARITSIRVAPGDRVQAGQLIATLVPDPLVQAESAKAQTALELARKELARQERLVAGGVAPRAQLDQARAAFESAQADAQAKRAAYNLAQTNTALRAPRAGVVTQLNGAVGQTADTATPIALLANLDEVGVVAELPAEQVVRLRSGEAVTVLGPDQAAMNGRVRNVQGAVDTSTQRAQVLIAAPNPDMRLKPGMFTTVVMRLGAHRGLLVPPTAVVPREAGNVVYVVAEGVAHERPVKTRPGPDQTKLEVLSGLKPGEVVATDGAYELSDGMKTKEGR